MGIWPLSVLIGREMAICTGPINFRSTFGEFPTTVDRMGVQIGSRTSACCSPSSRPSNLAEEDGLPDTMNSWRERDVSAATATLSGAESWRRRCGCRPPRPWPAAGSTKQTETFAAWLRVYTISPLSSAAA